MIKQSSYRSPYRIFGLPVDAGAYDIQRAKLRLLAEFELTDDPEILVAGIRLSKNDIDQLAEALADPHAAFLHRAIAENPALCEFLETGNVYPGYTLQPQQPGAAALLEPLVMQQFDAQLSAAFTRRDALRIQALCLAVSTLMYDWRNYPFMQTTQQLQREITAMKLLAGGVRRHVLYPLQHFLSLQLQPALQALPQVLDDERGQYGLALAGIYAEAAGEEIAYEAAKQEVLRCAVYFPKRFDLLAKLTRFSLRIGMRMWLHYASMLMALTLLFAGIALAAGHVSVLPREFVLIFRLVCVFMALLCATFTLYLTSRSAKQEQDRRSAVAQFFFAGFLAMPVYWVIWLRPQLGRRAKWQVLILMLAGLLLILGTNIVEAW